MAAILPQELSIIWLTCPRTNYCWSELLVSWEGKEGRRHDLALRCRGRVEHLDKDKSPREMGVSVGQGQSQRTQRKKTSSSDLLLDKKPNGTVNGT